MSRDHLHIIYVTMGNTDCVVCAHNFISSPNSTREPYNAFSQLWLPLMYKRLYSTHAAAHILNQKPVAGLYCLRKLRYEDTSLCMCILQSNCVCVCACVRVSVYKCDNSLFYMM